MLLRRHANRRDAARRAAAEPVADIVGLSAPYKANVPELRAELERRGLDPSGLKAELVARLTEHDATPAAPVEPPAGDQGETPDGTDETPAEGDVDQGTEPAEGDVDGQTPETSESGETLADDTETPADETGDDTTTEDE